MKRVLALVGAILLVAVAVVVRGMLDDDGDGGNGGPAGDADLVVACIPELRDACRALDAEVRFENPAETLAHADEVDAWVTFDPWPEMAGFDLAPNPFGAVRRVASTELVLVTRQDVSDHCGEVVDWSCAVEASGSRAAVGRPTTAGGLLTLGWAAFDWSQVTRPGEPFARSELELPEFQAWLNRVDRRTADPLADALQLGVAGPHAFGTSAVAASGIAGTREEGQLVAHRGAHPASVAVVVAGPAAGRIAGNADFVAALVDAGWSPGGSPATTGLPTAGVLVALLLEVSS